MIYKDLLLNKNNFNQLINYYKNNKIQNAYIFHGQEGIGKEAHAIEFFALINCENLKDNYLSCGICNSCIKISSLQHELLNIIIPLPKTKNLNKNDSALKALDEKQIKEITNMFILKGKDPYFKVKFNKANTILINSIKEIKKNIQLSIPSNKYKLHLIFDAEKLCYPKSESANALLKVLEEPTKNNFFILITSDLSKILDTIKSRCTTIFFNPIDYNKQYKYLIDRKVEHKYAEIIPKLSFGNINYSLLIAKNFNQRMKKLFHLIESIFNTNLIKWKKEFLLIKDKDKIIEYCIFLELLIRDISNYQLTKNKDIITFKNFENYIVNISDKYNIDMDKFSKFINITINNINLNGNPQLMITGLFFELNCLLNNQEDLIDIKL